MRTTRTMPRRRAPALSCPSPGHRNESSAQRAASGRRRAGGSLGGCEGCRWRGGRSPSRGHRLARVPRLQRFSCRQRVGGRLPGTMEERQYDALAGVLRLAAAGAAADAGRQRRGVRRADRRPGSRLGGARLLGRHRRPRRRPRVGGLRDRRLRRQRRDARARTAARGGARHRPRDRPVRLGGARRRRDGASGSRASSASATRSRTRRAGRLAARRSPRWPACSPRAGCWW